MTKKTTTNTILVHATKMEILEQHIYPTLLKKLSLKKVTLRDLEKLLNYSGHFVGVKGRLVKKGCIYRMKVEEPEEVNGTGRAFFEDSIVYVRGVPRGGKYNVRITQTDYFHAQGVVVSESDNRISSELTETTKYYLYNHHLIIELLYVEKCRVFTLRQVMCVERASPLLKAQLHLWESCTLDNAGKWNFACFSKEDRFHIECPVCEGSGKVCCSKCHGETSLSCVKCNAVGHFTCRKCSGNGYTFLCKVCDGKGRIWNDPVKCNRCNGTGTYEWADTCRRCKGTGSYQGKGPCFTCKGSGTYSGSNTCPNCRGTGLHREGGERECHFCHGNARRECGVCDGSGQLTCRKCSGSGRVDCSQCEATGKASCRECGAKGTIPCHLKSIRHASDCERQCSEEVRVVLDSGSSEIVLNRMADVLVASWEAIGTTRLLQEATRYHGLIKEKAINEEFEAVRNYISIDQRAQEDEFAHTMKSVEYHRVEAAMDHAYEGCIRTFFTETDCRDDFKKSEIVEIPTAPESTIGVVSDAGRDHLKVRFRETGEVPSCGTIQHRFLKTTFRCQRDCVSYFLDKNANELPIKNILCHMATVKPPRTTSCRMYFNKHVAQMSKQKEVVDLASSKAPIMLVQGPPGTGKTTVIYEMIKQVLLQPKVKVLMASQSNAAVDNVLQKLHDDTGITDDIFAVRIGREEAFTMPDAKEYLFPLRFRDFQENLISGTEQTHGLLSGTVNGLKTDISELTELIRVEEQTKNTNKKLSVVKKQFSKHLAGKRKVTESISEANKMVQILEQKIQQNKANSLKKTLSSLLSVFKIDSKSKLARVNTKLSNLSQQEGALDKLIRKAKSSRKQLDLRLNQLSDEMNKFSGQLIQMSKRGLAALKEDQEVRMGLLQRKECVFSLLKEWKAFVNTGQEALADYLKKRANLVFSTCVGIHLDKYFNDTDFDMVIVDEGSRATLMEIMIPLVRGRRFVLVGDHLQLPPTVSRKTMEFCRKENVPRTQKKSGHFDYLDCLKGAYCGRTCYYSRSFFEQLFRADNLPDALKLRLDTQFRMHPDIADFIAETFYPIPLFHGDGTDKKKLASSSFPKQIHIVPTMPYGKERHEESRGFSKINPLEAEKTCEVIAKLAKEISEPVTVGVLAFYKSQVERIKSDMSRAKLNLGRISELEIATLDSYQGKEMDIIIVSFVRSPRPSRNANLSFVLDMQRLNVALSRARKKLLIIGDTKALAKESKRLNAEDDVISCLVNYVKKRGSVIEFWANKDDIIGR